MRENIFAFGDVCLTSLNEEKTVPGLKFLSEYLYKNLVQHASGLRPSNQIPSTIPTMSIVSLGPSYGILILNGLVSYNNEAGKKKFEITD